MIAAGKYRGVCVAIGLGLTEKGNEQITATFRIVVGPEDGQMLPWYGYFSEKSSARTMQSLCAMGWQGDDITEFCEEGAHPPQTEVELDVEHNTYEGNTTARVAWVNGAIRKPLEGAARAAFKARMMALTGATPKIPGGDKLPF